MAFNPLALLQEQQCSPIYNSLDQGDTESALKQCNELLWKQPDLHLATALKSIALTRIGQKQEANNLADALIKSNAASGSKSVLQALCMTLSSLNRLADEIDVLEAASKANPNSMEIGTKALTTMVKAGQWQKAQQAALRLHKVATTKDKSKDEYFWSSMQAYSLIANDPNLPGSKLALPLAQRMIAKHLESRPFGPQADEIMFLYVSILRKIGGDQIKMAIEVLNSEPRGKDLCKRSMTLASLRTEVLEETKDWRTIYSESMTSLESGDENWTTIQQAVKSAIHLTQSEASFSLAETEKSFQQLATRKGKNRSLRLAPLYLIKEVYSIPTLSNQLVDSTLLKSFTNYFDTFSTKACAFEDLSPYAAILSDQEVQSANQMLSRHMNPSPHHIHIFDNLNNLYQNLNACKLARLMQSAKETTANSEEEAARKYFTLYLYALPLGKDLPKTEMQPADEYALLASQALMHLSHLHSQDDRELAAQNILLAIIILKAALIYSPKGYRLRVLLIQLLQQCGAIDLARKEYEEIGIKSIQHDTLGWLIVNRAAGNVMMLPPSSAEEQRYISSVNKLQSVWREGKVQVPQMVAKAFGSGIYSRVEELIEFGTKLENSLTRWTMVIESARMSSSSSMKVNLDWSNELQQCALSTANAKVSNQQDHDVLINLMPKACPSIAELIAEETKRNPTNDYLKAMLPIAMLHVDIPLPENHEVLYQSPELSEEEQLLLKLGINLERQANNDLTVEVIALLDATELNIKESGKPSRAFHAASVALEGLQLISKVKSRGKVVLLDETRLKPSMTALLDALKTTSWQYSPKVSSKWLALLGKLPAALRQCRNAQDMLNSQAKVLNLQIDTGKAALLQRFLIVCTELDISIS